MYAINWAGLGSFIVAACFGNLEHELFALRFGSFQMGFVSGHFPIIRTNCSAGAAPYTYRTIVDNFDCHVITGIQSANGFILVADRFIGMAMIEEFKLLEKNGFGLLPYMLTENEDEAAAAAKKIGYPVALKIVSEEISHKSDIGGVKVRIKDEAALRLAHREITENVKGRKVDGILVQKMARKGIELIIGGKKDPQFGHMVVLGLGGVYVEIFRDVTARICPVTDEDVKEMVEELKSHPLLEGARGEKPIDMKALRKMVLGVCRFIMKEDIKELDLNPVIFDENGGDIVDVRFTR